MQIEGAYTLQATPEEVWNCLRDQQTVQQALPGLERLTQIDDQTYDFALQIRHAPLRGVYAGRAVIAEQPSPATCHLDIEGEDQAHPFRCECEIGLQGQNEHTVVNYQGIVELGHNGTLIPAVQVKATVKVLLQHFFTALTDQLRAVQEPPVYLQTLEELYEMPMMEEQTSEQLLLMRQDSPPTLLHRLVRRAGLGQNDPVQEEQWVRRLRQVGFVSLLLLLLWVGTRLPKGPTTQD